MSEFTKPPTTILPDLPALLTHLENPGDHWADNAYIKSVALCDLIETMHTESERRFAYNSDVKARAISEWNLPSEDIHTEGTALSTLIYFAQGYVEHDHLVRNGFVPFTQALVDQAGTQKAKIEFPSGTLANVRLINRQWYAMKPKARKYAFAVNPSQPAKIVKGK